MKSNDPLADRYVTFEIRRGALRTCQDRVQKAAQLTYDVGLAARPCDYIERMPTSPIFESMTMWAVASQDV